MSGHENLSAARLLAALRKFGVHEHDCGRPGDCTCGLDAALAEKQPAERDEAPIAAAPAEEPPSYRRAIAQRDNCRAVLEVLLSAAAVVGGCTKDESRRLALGQLAQTVQAIRAAMPTGMPGGDCHLTTLRQFAELVADTCESALHHHDSRGRGGQQCGYHGDFANIVPSNLRTLREWARLAREALGQTGRTS